MDLVLLVAVGWAADAADAEELAAVTFATGLPAVLHALLEAALPPAEERAPSFAFLPALWEALDAAEQTLLAAIGGEGRPRQKCPKKP